MSNTSAAVLNGLSSGDLIAVGSYTESYGAFRAAGDGVTLLRFERASGNLAVADRLSGLPNPAYLRWHPNGHLYAVIETDDDRAGIAVLSIDRRAGRIRLVDRKAVPGRIPCHLDLDADGSRLACACYGSGEIFVWSLDDRGLPSEIVGVGRHVGRSVHPQRQRSAHPHAACFSPDGRSLVVPDLGTDELWCYRIGTEEGRLAVASRWRAPPASGPRLAQFSSDGRHLILVHELASEVSSLAWNEGRPAPVKTCSTLAAPPARPNTAAGLRWHPSNELFAVSNRGADSVAIFRFSPATGSIALIGETPSLGTKPRDFDFPPCGRRLVLANQDSDEVIVFAFDADRGSLNDTGFRATVRSPSCVRFLSPVVLQLGNHTSSIIA